MTGDSLAAQAKAFAEGLTDTVRALVPDCAPFEAELLEDRPDRERFWVRQNPDTGIPLSVSGKPILTLTVLYYCCLDGEGRWLATDESHVKVYAGAKAAKDPLLRYHYRRQGPDDLPAAHIHVHAHRDGLSHVLGQSGTKTKRGKARAQGESIPRMAELHFPVGGHRFRPCLEDVLEMLVTELGVDHPDGAIDALREGRERWRRNQTRTVVRDAPDEAIAVLSDLRFKISLRRRRQKPKESAHRLREF